MQTKKIFLALVITFNLVNAYSQLQETNSDLKLPQSSFSISVTPAAGPANFNLQVQNPEKKKLNLQITHSILGVAVDTTIYTESFSCRYNMGNAEDGRYIIVVSSGKEKIIKEIEVNTATTRNLLIH